jgi:hypothetical protein
LSAAAALLGQRETHQLGVADQLRNLNSSTRCSRFSFEIRGMAHPIHYARLVKDALQAWSCGLAFGLTLSAAGNFCQTLASASYFGVRASYHCLLRGWRSDNARQSIFNESF